MIKEINKVLIVAAHPDDEVLGCGGTIAKLISKGCKIKILFMSDGVSSRTKNIKNFSKYRKNAAKNTSKILGCLNPIFYNFPDNKMDSIPLLNITKKIEKVINDFKPDTIFTHFNLDLNIDHQVTSRAVITAARPQTSCSVRNIFFFEILSSTEWSANTIPVSRPTYIVNIEKFISIKKKCLLFYKKELKKSPHSRSLDSIFYFDKLRGETNGFKYAEAFHVQKILEK